MGRHSRHKQILYECFTFLQFYFARELRKCNNNIIIRPVLLNSLLDGDHGMTVCYQSLFAFLVGVSWHDVVLAYTFLTNRTIMV